jgi:hypothetical protein
VELQLVGEAVFAFVNVTVLWPLLPPKFFPAMLITAPTAPVAGDKLVILAAGTGMPTWESKLPFAVPSISSSPLKVFEMEMAVRLIPTQR